MKSHQFIVMVFVLAFVGFSTGLAQQSAEQLYQSGLYQEEIEGDLEAAIKIYETIISNYPDNRPVAAKTYLHIGLCYEKLGLEEAQKAYRKVVQNYPEQTAEVALARGRITRLEAYVVELNTKAEKHMKQGNELFKVWEYEDAIKEYENAIKLRPNTLLAMNAQYCIGQSWYRAGKYDAALATLTNLMNENPHSTMAPVTELMVSQVQHAMENSKNPGTIKLDSDENTIVDPATGITYTKIKTLAGKSDIIALPGSLKLSPNGKHLLCESMVVPMDGSAPFELIDYHSTGILASRGIWSSDGTQAAFYSGDALCVVPVSPETGHTTGPVKKINNVALRWQRGPGWSPNGEKLAYNDPNGNIWTIDADGNNLKQITKSDIGGVGPAWSPDGKTIAYLNKNKKGLSLYNIEKDKSTEFADFRGGGSPVWSPDGEWILLPGEIYHFYNLNNERKFEFSSPEGIGSFFSWTPEDNKLLYFRTSYFSNAGLKIASSVGGPSFEPVKLLTNWGSAVWSENSKLMAVQGEDEKGDIAFRIVPLTGAESFVIDLDNLTDGKPFPFSISSGLDKLLFNVAREDGKEDLYVVPVSAVDARTTGPAVKIFEGWSREGAFNIIKTMSSDGEKVALLHEGDIWIAFTNGDEPIRVKEIPGDVGYIRWAPDGKKLIFHSSSGWNLLENPGPHGKIITLLDEGKKIECRHWNISFSPNNLHFAILSEENIKIIPFDKTKSSQKLSLGELDLTKCWNLKWSPDSKSLAFIGVKGTEDPGLFPDDKYQIYNVPVNGGQPIRVVTDDTDSKDFLSWSPDGKWIAYSPEVDVKVRPESTIWEADFEEIKQKLLSQE